jgi:hypothetical protein
MEDSPDSPPSTASLSSVNDDDDIELDVQRIRKRPNLTLEERAARLAKGHKDWINDQEYKLLSPMERLEVGQWFGWLGKSNHHIGPGGTYKQWYLDAQAHADAVEQDLYDTLLLNKEDSWQSILYYHHVHAQMAYHDSARLPFGNLRPEVSESQ